MKKLVVVLLLTGCVNVSNEPFGVVAVQDKTFEAQGQWYSATYVIHFTRNVDRYSIYYWYCEDQKWQYGWVEYDNMPKISALRTIGIQKGFEINQDLPVKIEIIAYAGNRKFPETVTHTTYINEKRCLESHIGCDHCRG